MQAIKKVMALTAVMAGVAGFLLAALPMNLIMMHTKTGTYQYILAINLPNGPILRFLIYTAKVKLNLMVRFL